MIPLRSKSATLRVVHKQTCVILFNVPVHRAVHQCARFNHPNLSRFKGPCAPLSISSRTIKPLLGDVLSGTKGKICEPLWGLHYWLRRYGFSRFAAPGLAMPSRPFQ